jgi:hypothetical protein
MLQPMRFRFASARGSEPGNLRRMTNLISTPVCRYVILSGSLLALTLLSVGRMDDELNYDESIYLTISRAISRTGLPYHHTGPSMSSGRYIFATSPPLVMYVASIPLRWQPTQPWGSRALHFVVFVLPLYFLLAFVAIRELGFPTSAYALSALLFSGFFLEWVHRVQLDVPLAFFPYFHCGYTRRA